MHSQENREKNPYEYKLDDDNHKKVLKRILDIYFEGLTSSENPITVILGGQPGAGKSTSRHLANEKIPNGNYLIIDIDALRIYHPDAEKIFLLHDKNFACYTNPDVSQWSDKMLEEALSNHHHIILESSMRSNWILTALQDPRIKNRQVDIILMSVNNRTNAR